MKFVQPADYRAVVQAMQRLVVRGAPLIGVAGAFGLAQEAWHRSGVRGPGVREQPETSTPRGGGAEGQPANRGELGLGRGAARAAKFGILSIPTRDLPELLEQEARAIQREEEVRSVRMGGFGAALIGDRFRMLTICNTGFLAAPGLGTALAAVYAAHRQGKRNLVYVPGNQTAVARSAVDCVGAVPRPDSLCSPDRFDDCDHHAGS